MPAQVYEFGAFRLDAAERQLVRDGNRITVRGKVLDTLCALVQRPGRLLRKGELLKAVWPDSIVEENNLEHNICVLRKVLGQRNGDERFIETVPRQGYRFVADVQVVPEVTSTPWVEACPDIFVAERDAQLQQLQRSYKKAQSGARQIVFLTGEAGIGKTTLARRFIAEIQQNRDLRIVLGECVDQRGPREAYMPLLEAFSRLCGRADGAVVVEILRRRAPSWLFQIPPATTDEERSTVQQSLVGLTQERMLREGVDALQAMAANRLLVLVLEDLHWSDSATLDFLLRVGRGQEHVHLLIVATFRPTEVRGGSHSVSSLVQQLRLIESCQVIPLQSLSEEGIANYLRDRLRGSIPSSLACSLHQRTEGNPLFVKALTNFWIANGCLHEERGSWKLAANGATFEAPDNLRCVIEEQVEQLQRDEQEIVEAASVAGTEFCVSTVAAALDRSSAEVESKCDAMTRAGRFFVAGGQSDWPDGTICQRYRFIHSMYREVTYRRVPAGLRVRGHVKIAERLEQAVASQESRISTQLAFHFQRGCDARRAIHYLKMAAQQCLERGSPPPDAVFHLTSALEMLRRIPEREERKRLELGINFLLAPALGATKGFADAETEAAFRRAYELARQFGEEERQFPIIFGFAVMLELRGQYRKAQEFMEKYLPDEKLRGSYLLEGLNLLACSRFHQGAFADALQHAERGAKVYNAANHSMLSESSGENVGIDCQAWIALALWFLGHPDRALAQAKQAATLAEDQAYSYCRVVTWLQRAILHQLRQEAEATRRWSERAMTLAAGEGFPYREAVGKVLHGWALAQQGQVKPGIAELKQGITGCCTADADLDRPYHLALLAEAYLLARDRCNGAIALQEAMEQAKSTRSFFYEAELWRLQGHLHWAFATDRAAAAKCFLRSLNVAKRQQARSLELRAAMSLARLLRDCGECRRAAELLAPVYCLFSGVGETPDLRDARLELEALEENAACDAKRLAV
jgi:DNA-binding winged helix-turn-helix (wHTH) protein